MIEAGNVSAKKQEKVNYNSNENQKNVPNTRVRTSGEFVNHILFRIVIFIIISITLVGSVELIKASYKSQESLWKINEK